MFQAMNKIRPIGLLTFPLHPCRRNMDLVEASVYELRSRQDAEAEFYAAGTQEDHDDYALPQSRPYAQSSYFEANATSLQHQMNFLADSRYEKDTFEYGAPPLDEYGQ